MNVPTLGEQIAAVERAVERERHRLYYSDGQRAALDAQTADLTAALATLRGVTEMVALLCEGEEVAFWARSHKGFRTRVKAAISAFPTPPTGAENAE